MLRSVNTRYPYPRPLDMGTEGGNSKLIPSRGIYLLLFELCSSIFNIACSGALDLECTVHISE